LPCRLPALEHLRTLASVPRDEGSRHCPDGMTYDLVLMVSGDRRHAEELRQEVTSMRLRLHPAWSAAVCAAPGPVSLPD